MQYILIRCDECGDSFEFETNELLLEHENKKIEERLFFKMTGFDICHLCASKITVLKSIYNAATRARDRRAAKKAQTV